MLARRAVDELDALGELLVAADDGRLRDADRALDRGRLDEQREIEMRGSLDLDADGEDGEARHVDAVIVKNLFRERLVVRER